MSTIPELLNLIINNAINESASDIHLEPQANDVKVRYRIDGLLKESQSLHKSKHSAIISRIKIMVNLDIAETRVPQDGRTHFNGLDLRISVIPTFHGEKAVIRLLDTSQAQLSLAGVGMQPDDLSLYKRMISNRSGIILITGPTGCGKTTTLYATLSHLHSKEINIITIEDPIEYQLAGINQIQVNKKAGLTFSHGLRSILRQDPDIIMVGEIRDLETAKIAFQSALTGHLVLSTLHTNDAASALPRLIDIGIEKYFVDACLIGVVSQRLVRKLSKDGGYKGRTGIFEILHNGKTIRSMVDDGLAKIKQGITSKQELSRVLYLD